jgi:hypothetical protein
MLNQLLLHPDRHSFYFGSARFAFELIFNSLHQVAYRTRNKVILPAFTCQVLENSVLMAGLVPVYCDIEPNTYSYDLPSLLGLLDDCGDCVLCVVVQHTYGCVSNDYSDIISLLSSRNVIAVDDCCHFTTYECAQLLGACSVFSFQASKGMPFVHGGLLKINNSFLNASCLLRVIDNVRVGWASFLLLAVQFVCVALRLLGLNPFFRKIENIIIRKFGFKGMRNCEVLGDLSSIGSDRLKRTRMPLLSQFALRCLIPVALPIFNSRRNKVFEMMSPFIDPSFIRACNTAGSSPLMIPSTSLNLDSFRLSQLKSIVDAEVGYHWFTASVFPRSSLFDDEYFIKNFPCSCFIASTVFTLPTLLSAQSFAKLELLMRDCCSS